MREVATDSDTGTRRAPCSTLVRIVHLPNLGARSQKRSRDEQSTERNFHAAARRARGASLVARNVQTTAAGNHDGHWLVALWPVLFKPLSQYEEIP